MQGGQGDGRQHPACIRHRSHPLVPVPLCLLSTHVLCAGCIMPVTDRPSHPRPVPPTSPSPFSPSTPHCAVLCPCTQSLTLRLLLLSPFMFIFIYIPLPAPPYPSSCRSATLFLASLCTQPSPVSGERPPYLLSPGQCSSVPSDWFLSTHSLSDCSRHHRLGPPCNVHNPPQYPSWLYPSLAPPSVIGRHHLDPFTLAHLHHAFFVPSVSSRPLFPRTVLPCALNQLPPSTAAPPPLLPPHSVYLAHPRVHSNPGPGRDARRGHGVAQQVAPPHPRGR